MMDALTRNALRYLGVRGGDAVAEALVAEGFSALDAIEPRHWLATYPVAEVLAALDSASLAAYLAGCGEAALLAATLGAGADQLIRRAEAIDTARAAALHACAAAKIEAYVDAVQANVSGAMRPRFSPGYGDFSLAAQEKLLAMTDAGRRIGLYLTAGSMLVPSKSITAVLGLGPSVDGCAEGKCARCGKTDCAFREEEPLA